MRWINRSVASAIGSTSAGSAHELKAEDSKIHSSPSFLIREITPVKLISYSPGHVTRPNRSYGLHLLRSHSNNKGAYEIYKRPDNYSVTIIELSCWMQLFGRKLIRLHSICQGHHIHLKNRPAQSVCNSVRCSPPGFITIEHYDNLSKVFADEFLLR